MSWLNILPHSAVLISGILLCSGFICLGPQFAQPWAGSVLTLPFALSVAFLFICSFVGPDSLIPFQRHPIYMMLLVAVADAAVTVIAYFGGVPSYSPPEPYTNVRDPLSKAILDTMRSMDTCTDAGMIKHLIVQA